MRNMKTIVAFMVALSVLTLSHGASLAQDTRIPTPCFYRATPFFKQRPFCAETMRRAFSKRLFYRLVFKSRAERIVRLGFFGGAVGGSIIGGAIGTIIGIVL